jgi:hypothetical protein
MVNLVRPPHRCECGSVIGSRTCIINNHLKTKKHQDFLLNGIKIEKKKPSLSLEQIEKMLKNNISK